MEKDAIVITIQIITNGASYRITADQAEFVVACAHCHAEFLTIDPDRKYCRQTHRTRAYEQRVTVLTAQA